MVDVKDLLVQDVVNGKVTENTSTKTTSKEQPTTGTTNLGKDAFLQLLVAEMQNQDPLEPSTNTEWISQLATFSQLEELQGLSSTTENSQIFSLIGKNVVLTTKDASGNAVYKSGVVDYVTFNGGETKFSVNGNLYGMENLYSVQDSDYHYETCKPSMKDKISFKYDGERAQDLQFDVDMGKEEAKAENVALLIGKAVLSPDYITVSGNHVTVSREILNQLEPGTYSVDLVFDDKNYTTEYGAITLEVYNTNPVKPEDTDAAEETGDTETVEGAEEP